MQVIKLGQVLNTISIRKKEKLQVTITFSFIFKLSSEIWKMASEAAKSFNLQSISAFTLAVLVVIFTFFPFVVLVPKKFNLIWIRLVLVDNLIMASDYIFSYSF